MYQIFDVWNFIVTIKTCAHNFYFCYQNKTLKKLPKMLFVLSKNILLSSRLSNFHTSLFPSFILSWPSTSDKVKFWSWYLVSWQSFYIEKVFTEKFGCPKANLGLPHRLADNLAQLILITTKVPGSLGMRLGPKAWPSI